ncbi:MAG: EAL domain-containing protein [Piscinibacter sp.]|nr:EAL domain-containing protein [Piscinibacter sp.]
MNPLVPILLVNAAVSLLVGVALLLVWRRNLSLRFSRDLGWAFIVQSCAPAAFLLWRGAQMPAQAVGGVTLVACAVAYLTLMIAGVAHLTRRPLSRRTLTALVAGLVLLIGGSLSLQAQFAQGVTSTAHLVVALVAASWLWQRGRTERIAGGLLVLLACTHYGFALFGEAALPAQASVAAVVRAALGLTLLFAALDQSSAESQRLRENYRRMIENSHQGVAVFRGEQMLYANPALLRIYGIADPAGAPANWRNATIPEEERAAVRERHRRILSGEVEHATWEGRRHRPDGTPLQLRFGAWRIDWDGEPAEQLVVSDETAHRDTLHSLLVQATHDDLTGLPNRSALLQRLRELCGAEPGVPFALMLLDVDRFKLFNDAHGPSVGDEVLKTLANGLVVTVGGQAEVMRLGEDEFALLVVDPDPEGAARRLGTQVREFIARPLESARRRVFLDLSIGVALHPQTARDADAVLRAANAAMHEAKRTPGTSLQFAEERFERGSGATLEVEQALRAGWMTEEFSLVYQPKVDARSGVLVGFEALARWDRPGFDSVDPSAFIATAERIGLIGPLGEAILVRACQQIAQWREDGVRIVPVAVNVSALQLLDPDFPALVQRTLQRFGLPSEALTLELTETAAVTHIEQARSQIERMRADGVGVALDDFGTGFSSLRLLSSLPLQGVKIDRSLIEPLPATDAVAIVRAICDLARVLDLDVVAEGIETDAQAAAAALAGCHVLQGTLIAKALTPAEAARWKAAPLARRRAAAAARGAVRGG